VFNRIVLDTDFPTNKILPTLLISNSFIETSWLRLCFFALPSVADLTLSLRQTDKAAVQRNQVSKQVIYET